MNHENQFSTYRSRLSSVLILLFCIKCLCLLTLNHMFVCTVNSFRLLYPLVHKQKIIMYIQVQESRIILLLQRVPTFFSPIPQCRWWLMNLCTRDNIKAMTTTAFEEDKKKKTNEEKKVSKERGREKLTTTN